MMYMAIYVLHMMYVLHIRYVVSDPLKKETHCLLVDMPCLSVRIVTSFLF